MSLRLSFYKRGRNKTVGVNIPSDSGDRLEAGEAKIEAKIDEIIAGNAAVKAQLKKRTFWFLVASVIFIVILSIFGFQLNRLNGIANGNKQLNQNTNSIVTTLNNATGPEAQAKSQAVLAGAIAELRRSFDCAAIYVYFKETPSQCSDVVGRIDALRKSG